MYNLLNFNVKETKMVYTVHGWSFDGNIWLNTPFSNGIHFELPGHGDSDFEITDIFELAKILGERMHKGSILVGWSIGASIATLIAAFFPGKIERLILYSPTPLFCGLSQPQVVCVRFLKRLRRDFEGTVNWFRKECGFKGDYPLPEREKAVAVLESYMKADLRAILPDLSVKTEIVVGLKDEITKPEGAFSFFSLLPSSNLEIHPLKPHFFF